MEPTQRAQRLRLPHLNCSIVDKNREYRYRYGLIDQFVLGVAKSLKRPSILRYARPTQLKLHGSEITEAANCAFKWCPKIDYHIAGN